MTTNTKPQAAANGGAGVALATRSTGLTLAILVILILIVAGVSVARAISDSNAADDGLALAHSAARAVIGEPTAPLATVAATSTPTAAPTATTAPPTATPFPLASDGSYVILLDPTGHPANVDLNGPFARQGEQTVYVDRAGKRYLPVLIRDGVAQLVRIDQ